jgi:cadmium resistance protein CadD (predicted permease)
MTLKLIAFIAAAIPILVFLNAVFFRRSKVMKEASSAFRTQVGYLAWGIMILAGCAFAYAIGKLIYSVWS